MVHARGVGKELGQFVGEAMRHLIQKRVEQQAWLHEAMAKYESGALRSVVDSLASAGRAAYPQLWEEMKGMAHGSQVEFLYILLMNLQREIRYFVPGDSERAKYVQRMTSLDMNCTDVSYKGPEGWWLCHNEDGGDAADMCFLYMLQVNGDHGTFTGLTYAGELPSSAFGYNSSGLVFTMDGLSPLHLDLEGVPRNFVSRKLMEAKTMDEAIQIVTQARHSVGHNYNIASIAQEGTDPVSVETAPGGLFSVQTWEDICSFHVNRYLRLKTQQIPNPSSEHREKRVRELLPVNGLDGLLSILSDRKDKAWPIFDPHGNGSTYCTAVFDLMQRRVEVYLGNPLKRECCFSDILVEVPQACCL